MRILIAEDDRADRRLLEARLEKWGYEAMTVGDGDEAAAILTGEDPPRLAIMDWVMPGRDGPDVCRKVRRLAREPYVYILLLTGKDGQDDIVEGMNAGADDYITKPWHPRELETRLRAGRRIVELQQTLMETRDAMQFEATHDTLTGLWNRGAALMTLDREVARADRESTPLSVIIMDLDRFKRINDTYGHPAGDAVLREVSRRLASCARPYDTVGRYGGEEFVIIVPGCDEEAGAEVARRLCRCVGSEPVQAEEGNLAITGSFGVAARARGAQGTVDSLLKAADDAMYRAKAQGGNRVAVATSEAALQPA